MNPKNVNQLWHLAGTLTVQQAAVLVAGLDPNAVRFNSLGGAWLENEDELTESIAWVQTAFAAITNAITAGKLPAKIVHDSRPVTEEDAQILIDTFDVDCSEVGRTSYPSMEELAGDDERLIKNCFVKNKPNWEQSLVDRMDLVAWLRRNGQSSGFFFPSDTSAPDYLDPNNPRYAPKLAAAVKAWQATADENLTRGKSPLQALESWLESRYKELGLVHLTSNEKNRTKAGDINKSAVSEASKVANWLPTGGAPRTP